MAAAGIGGKNQRNKGGRLQEEEKITTARLHVIIKLAKFRMRGEEMNEANKLCARQPGRARAFASSFIYVTYRMMHGS